MSLKRTLCVVLAVLLLTGCQQADADVTEDRLKDDLGNAVEIENPQQVASAVGSLAEIWELAGGEICGATEDAFKEGRLKNAEGVQKLGTIKEPNLEEILALQPDFMLLSANLSSHQELQPSLEAAGIAVAYFDIETFADYLRVLKLCTTLTERPDLYEENGTRVEEQVQAVLDKVPADQEKDILLLRAYSTDMRVKNSDSLVGAMLLDLGCQNIADCDESLLENLSMEKILVENPDFIFITTMGEAEEAAKLVTEEMLTDQSAWQALHAIKEGNYAILPKDLFHYKPNAEWGESYEVLWEILYGDKKTE